MVSKYAYKGAVWIDMTSPNRPEIEDVAESYGIPEPLFKAAANGIEKPSPDYILFSLSFPYRDPYGAIGERIFRFILGETMLVTMHDERDPSILKTAHFFESGDLARTYPDARTGGALFLILLERFYMETSEIIDTVSSEVRKLEESIRRDHGLASPTALSDLSRKVVDMKSCMVAHRETFGTITRFGIQHFGSMYTESIDRYSDKNRRFIELIEGEKAQLHIMAKTNATFVSHKAASMRKMLIGTVVIAALLIIGAVLLS